MKDIEKMPTDRKVYVGDLRDYERVYEDNEGWYVYRRQSKGGPYVGPHKPYRVYWLGNEAVKVQQMLRKRAIRG